MSRREGNHWLLTLGTLILVHCGGAATPPLDAGADSDATDASVADDASVPDANATDVATPDSPSQSDGRSDVAPDAGAQDAAADQAADTHRPDGDAPVDSSADLGAPLDSEPPFADGASADTDGVPDTPIEDVAWDVAMDGGDGAIITDVRDAETGSVDGHIPTGIITVQPTSGLSTNEGGGSTSFTMVLGLVPAADVTVNLSSTRIDEGTVAPAQVTFTPANWNVPKTITVTGIDDSFCDGDQPYLIVTAPSLSLDPDYAGIDPADVAVHNIDNEGGGLTVSPTVLTTTEAGGSATFTIVLNCEPMAAVNVPIGTQAAGEVTVAPAVVAFTQATWNMPHTVTVTGVDDNADDGDKVVTVSVGPSSSLDPGFDGTVGPDVSVTNVDND